MQTAISDSVSQWLQAHPVVFQLVQVLLWATNHPIISLIILVFAVAIAWSLIKALGRLLETVGWSLLQYPFKLSQVLIGVSAKSLGKFGGNDKQQRLAEISTRLEAIQKEQNELLQEAAAILARTNERHTNEIPMLAKSLTESDRVSQGERGNT